jgi:hypothetical protein
MWRLPVRERKSRLRDRWSLLHGPLHVIEPNDLVRLFRSVEFVSDGSEQPTTPLTVYRGALAGDGGRGMSWSTDDKHAGSYASGYRTVGATCLWRASCPPAAVLARFAFEDEVVVDPEMLIEIAVVHTLPSFALPVIKYTLPGGVTLGGRYPPVGDKGTV